MTPESRDPQPPTAHPETWAGEGNRAGEGNGVGGDNGAGEDGQVEEMQLGTATPTARRQVLTVAAFATIGFLPAVPWVISKTSKPVEGLSDAKRFTKSLKQLVDKTGRDAFLSVSDSRRESYFAFILTEEGGTQSWTNLDRRGWTRDATMDVGPSALISGKSLRLDELGLDRWDQWVRQARDAYALRIDVDSAGHRSVGCRTSSPTERGLLVDGSGMVTELDFDNHADVRRGLAEIVAEYGQDAAKVAKVGSYDGFVHCDFNVAGVRSGLRAIRDSTTSPRALVSQGDLFPPEALFDLDVAALDLELVFKLKDTIVESSKIGDAGVWDWSFERPPHGGEPTLNFGIGPHGPSTTTWVDSDGKVLAVQGNSRCVGDSGFCR